jgi:hypothetical protein
MTIFLTLWLAFIAAVGAVAWFGTARQALAFALIAGATAIVPAMTLSYPADRVPVGEFALIGFKIDEPRAIYILIDGTPPRYYRLPYHPGTAKELQDAQYSAEESGGTITMQNDGESAPGFSENAPPPLPPKTVEEITN